MTRLMTALVSGLAAAALAVALAPAGRAVRARDDLKSALAAPAGPVGSIQDALLRPYVFDFAKPTPLDEVGRRLAKDLGVVVVLDRAALDRQGLKVDDEVQLELAGGVRLKTGLKLLLDQLDLTYRVVAEDNLLILTDETGSADPTDKVLAEIKSLHLDLHDLQDAVDEVRGALGLDGGEGGAKMRKPTIIEEMPPADADKEKPKPKDAPSGRSRPGV